MSRPYVEDDLVFLTQMRHSDLYDLVDAQRSRWPKKSFSRSRLTKEEMYTELVNPANGFTTMLPMPQLVPKASGEADEAKITMRMDETTPPPLHLVPPVLSLLNISPQVTGHNWTIGVERTIKLYIFDSRLSGTQALPFSKVVQSIDVEVIDHVACKPGEWRAKSMDVFMKLQLSNSVITGDEYVKFGVPDEDNPEFTVWFLRGHLHLLSSATPQPDRLKVFYDTLILRIEQASPAKIPLSPTDYDYSLHNESSPSTSRSLKKKTSRPSPKRPKLSQDPSTLSSASSSSLIFPLKIVEDRFHTEDLAWLKDILSLRPGYATFVSSHSKILQNPSIVAQWTFAASFSSEYYNDLNDNGRRIKKGLIAQALGIGGTWLAQAEEGMKLIAIYGSGSSNPSEEVITELEAIRNPPFGSVRLLKYLQHYASTHPI